MKLMFCDYQTTNYKNYAPYLNYNLYLCLK